MTKKKKLTSPLPIGVKASFAPDSESFNLNLQESASVFKRKAADTMAFVSTTGTGVTRVPLLYVDPMFDPILLMFPKENIKELNRRLRHYYTYHPLVRTAIDMHSEFAISDFQLRCKDKIIEKEYQNIANKINLMELMIDMNRDYWLLGESFLFGNWDEINECWSNFVQLPPENIDIHKVYVGPGVIYMLKPDAELKKLLMSPKAQDQAIAKLLPEEYKEFLLQGKPFPLDNARTIAFIRRPAAYNLRGESVVKSILKDLIYEDKLRLLQYTFVDRHTHPIKIWKLGSAEKGWIPGKKHFQTFAGLLTQSANDADFNIITHPFVQAEFLTTVDKKEDLVGQFEFVQKRIMMGLFMSEAMLAGEGSPYATQAVSMKVLMHRYLRNRQQLERLIKQKIFLPIAVRRNYIKRTQAELDHNVRVSKDTQYVIPEFFWKGPNLLNNTALQEMLIRLREREEIPFELIADVFGWETETIKEAFKKEEGTCFDPLWRKTRESFVNSSKKIKQDLLSGKKTENWPLKKTKDDTEEETPLEELGPGRPPLGPLKTTPSPAVTSAPPREKLNEKEELPKPQGE